MISSPQEDRHQQRDIGRGKRQRSARSAGSLIPGSAAVRAETLKLQKYATSATNDFVSPLALETLGGPGPSTRELLATVGQLPQEVTGCQRAGELLLRRLSLDSRRRNAAAVMGTPQGYWGPLSACQNCVVC